jgi:hypothetical protein
LDEVPDFLEQTTLQWLGKKSDIIAPMGHHSTLNSFCAMLSVIKKI